MLGGPIKKFYKNYMVSVLHVCCCFCMCSKSTSGIIIDNAMLDTVQVIKPEMQDTDQELYQVMTFDCCRFAESRFVICDLSFVSSLFVRSFVRYSSFVMTV